MLSVFDFLTCHLFPFRSKGPLAFPPNGSSEAATGFTKLVTVVIRVWQLCGGHPPVVESQGPKNHQLRKSLVRLWLQP